MTQRVICILGMHRSGTSCLAGSLQEAGLFLGDVYTQNPFNLKGNRESPKIMRLHDKLLEDNGGSWHEPPAEIVWDRCHRELRDEIIADFSKYRVWGFKDPRTLLTMRGWIEVLPDLEVVGTFRHPDSVAESLEKRNPDLGGREKWLNLWNIYNEKLLALHRAKKIPLLDFDLDDDQYKRCIMELIAGLNIESDWFESLNKGNISHVLNKLFSTASRKSFFSPKLRSSVSTGERDLPDGVKRTYEKLKSNVLKVE